MKFVKSRIIKRKPLYVAIPRRDMLKDFSQNIVCVGSCFAEMISENLNHIGFDSYYSRENSRHYSVKTILEKLQRVKNDEGFLREEYLVKLRDSGKVASIKHPFLIGRDYRDLYQKVEKSEYCFAQRLKEADVVVFTVGTAKYVRRKSDKELIYLARGLGIDNEIVSQNFDELRQDLGSLFDLLKGLTKPGCQFVITVSPQRYGWSHFSDTRDYPLKAQWNDGVVSNTYDKNMLRVAVQEVLTSGKFDDYIYFPSYEIVLDELRDRELFDYNWNDDRHIRQETKNYIANCFIERCASRALKEYLIKFEKLENEIKRLPFLDVEMFSNILVNFAGIISENSHIGSFLHVEKQLRSNQVLKGSKINVPYDDSGLVKTVDEFLKRISSECDDEISVANEFDSIEDRIEKIENDSRIGIWGAGEFASQLFRNTNLLNKTNLKVFDSNYFSIGNYFGISVENPEFLFVEDVDVVIIGSKEFEEEIYNCLLEKRFSPSDIISLSNDR